MNFDIQLRIFTPLSCISLLLACLTFFFFLRRRSKSLWTFLFQRIMYLFVVGFHVSRMVYVLSLPRFVGTNMSEFGSFHAIMNLVTFCCCESVMISGCAILVILTLKLVQTVEYAHRFELFFSGFVGLNLVGKLVAFASTFPDYDRAIAVSNVQAMAIFAINLMFMIPLILKLFYEMVIAIPAARSSRKASRSGRGSSEHGVSSAQLRKRDAIRITLGSFAGTCVSALFIVSCLTNPVEFKLTSLGVIRKPADYVTIEYGGPSVAPDDIFVNSLLGTLLSFPFLLNQSTKEEVSKIMGRKRASTLPNGGTSQGLSNGIHTSVSVHSGNNLDRPTTTSVPAHSGNNLDHRPSTTV